MIINKIAEMLNTDLQTLGKSLGIGGTSTGVGYLVQAEKVNWNIQANLVDLVWAVLTCIILTLVSLFITKCYKKLESYFAKKKANKRGD